MSRPGMFRTAGEVRRFLSTLAVLSWGPLVLSTYAHSVPDPNARDFLERGSETTLTGSEPNAREILEEARSVVDTIRAEAWGITPALAREVRETADRHGIPHRIAFRLVWVESRFIPRAVSHAGALGLSQVMPPTARVHCGLSPEELFEPRQNLDCGFSYLAMLHRRFASWRTALASYNVGAARHLRAHRTGEPDGLGYARLVLREETE